MPRRGATKSGPWHLSQTAGGPWVAWRNPAMRLLLACGRGEQLRGGGGRAQLPGRAGMDAAEKRFDQPVGHLGTEARGDEVEHADVALRAARAGLATRQHQVERRPGRRRRPRGSWTGASGSSLAGAPRTRPSGKGAISRRRTAAPGWPASLPVPRRARAPSTGEPLGHPGEQGVGAFVHRPAQELASSAACHRGGRARTRSRRPARRPLADGQLPGRGQAGDPAADHRRTSSAAGPSPCGPGRPGEPAGRGRWREGRRGRG